MGNPDHILVVDDDLGLRELLDRYFAGNGYRVTSVANGRQMREVLANHRVDLIVLDLMLPGDDGLTLCRNLRANQPYDIPILMLTARGDEADRIVRPSSLYRPSFFGLSDMNTKLWLNQQGEVTLKQKAPGGHTRGLALEFNKSNGLGDSFHLGQMTYQLRWARSRRSRVS